MTKIKILDHGYVEFIQAWGSDQSIIEAARMSTDKGFLGWEPRCKKCGYGDSNSDIGNGCNFCNGTVEEGDGKLLKYLYDNKHATPFEMGGMVIEVKAPIFIFREWHRHRTQSYNEMSARYVAMPDENYVPTVERLLQGANTATTNKQAQGTGKLLTPDDALAWLSLLADCYEACQSTYEAGIALGVPKELARLCVPVGRYSRMRASCNLRNWLGFLALRQAPNAQWEIREFANSVCNIIGDHFPRTHGLFTKGSKHA